MPITLRNWWTEVGDFNSFIAIVFMGSGRHPSSLINCPKKGSSLRASLILSPLTLTLYCSSLSNTLSKSRMWSSTLSDFVYTRISSAYTRQTFLLKPSSTSSINRAEWHVFISVEASSWYNERCQILVALCRQGYLMISLSCVDGRKETCAM